jgi:hypothetical protein
VPGTARVLCPPEFVEQQQIETVSRRGTVRFYVSQELAAGFTDQMCFRATPSRSGATRGCFRTPNLKRHLSSGKFCQEERLNQVCLWTRLPEGEVSTMQSLLSIMLGDGHWMEEVEAGSNVLENYGESTTGT